MLWVKMDAGNTQLSNIRNGNSYDTRGWNDPAFFLAGFPTGRDEPALTASSLAVILSALVISRQIRILVAGHVGLNRMHSSSVTAGATAHRPQGKG
ncbi:hypothetical protein PPNSA23_04930 [Phyllobacterium phragmitis]|uniref:Uncharacterized protein n=1 Tax=Phyllobacterium phragmitis TaxID=2670329 RepID=A0ABQ0GV61_9HYPH